MEFTRYVHEQRPALLRFATVLTGQTWLAEDVVSDVLGRAYEKWDRIGGLDQPHAYVRRMVVNEHLSWRRRLHRTTPAADLEPHAGQTADGATDHAERDEMIFRLASLPPRQRAAVVLRFYLGLADDEIAEELGCRESTVRSQISRALGTLRIDSAGAGPAVYATSSRDADLRSDTDLRSDADLLSDATRPSAVHAAETLESR